MLDTCVAEVTLALMLQNLVKGYIRDAFTRYLYDRRLQTDPTED